MKKLPLIFASLMLIVSVTVSASAHPKQAKKSGKERTMVGYVSDSHCGLKHDPKMGDDKACTLKCVEGGGQFVLADRTKKVVYQLDKEGQERAREFAGQQVKLTGRVTGKSIHVSKIEPAA